MLVAEEAMPTMPLRILVAVAIAVTACGKSDTEKFADDYCSEVAKCCGQAGLPADGKLCYQWMTAASIGGKYNASAADACLAEVRAQQAAGTFCRSQTGASACDSVYGTRNGGKKPGEECQTDSDCAPSSDGTVACAGTYVNGSWINKCQVRIAGKAGDSPCLGTVDGDMFSGDPTSGGTDVVSRGYVCATAENLRCSGGACVALAGLGATCQISTDCIRSAYCNYPNDVCTAKIRLGDACTGIAGSECVDGAVCDTNAKTCVAKLANGATCGSSSACQSDYCSNGTCQGSSNIAMALLCGS